MIEPILSTALSLSRLKDNVTFRYYAEDELWEAKKLQGRVMVIPYYFKDYRTLSTVDMNTVVDYMSLNVVIRERILDILLIV